MQFMLVDLKKKLAPVGKLDLLDAIARRAAAYYDARGDLGSDEDTYLAAVARLGIGEVVGVRGDHNAALAQFSLARASLDRLAAQHVDITKYEVKAIEAERLIADIRQQQGDLPAALAMFRALLERAQLLPRVAPRRGRAATRCSPCRIASPASSRPRARPSPRSPRFARR